MKKLNLGVQMMMVKDKVAEKGLYPVMEDLNKMGFSQVEVSQIDMTEENIEGFKRAKKELGMEVLAISAPLYENPMDPKALYLEKDHKELVELCKALDTSYIRIGMMPLTIMDKKAEIISFAKDMEKISKLLEEEGIKLYYHNHHVEFVKLDGDYIIDLLEEYAPSVGFEIDVHWVQRGGNNPVDIIHRMDGKIDLLHLKDYILMPLSAEDFDFSKMDEFMKTFTGNIRFAEVGEGTLNWDKIIEAGIESKTKYFIIEQDDTYGKDVYECLKNSKKNLDEIARRNSWEFI